VIKSVIFKKLLNFQIPVFGTLNDASVVSLSQVCMTAILISLVPRWGGFHRMLFIPDFTKVSQLVQGWKISAKPCTRRSKKFMLALKMLTEM
jgi:hypothetical protein